MARIRHTVSFVLFTLIFSFAAHARVISYAPYTSRAATPAVQNRLNRHFVLVEQIGASNSVCCLPSPLPPNFYSFPPSQVVLYDSKGQTEPKVIFPQDGSSAAISMAAVREDDRQVPAILIQTNANFLGNNPKADYIWLLSNDAGNSWMRL